MVFLTMAMDEALQKKGHKMLRMSSKHLKCPKIMMIRKAWTHVKIVGMMMVVMVMMMMVVVVEQ